MEPAGSGSAANESASNAGADSGNHGGATGDSAHPGTEGSNAAGTDSAEEKAQKGGERAESGNDVAAISMDPEDSVSGPANASSDTGADDTGKMVRGKGTTKNGSAPVAGIRHCCGGSGSGWYYGRCENLQKTEIKTAYLWTEKWMSPGIGCQGDIFL